jgi:phosphate:Na+ symporter
MGAVLAVVSYSSLAIVLLTATLAASGVIPLDVALGLVLGANLGSGLLAVLTTAKSTVEVRQVPMGNFVFKVLGILIAAPLLGLWLRHVRPYLGDPATVVVMFHLTFNLLVGVVFIGITQVVAGWVQKPGCPSPKKPWRPAVRIIWTRPR